MDAYGSIRGCIPEISDFDLAQRSGMFCEYLQEALDSAGCEFPEGRFFFTDDEPYAVHFFWDLGDRTVDVSIMGDPAESGWTVVSNGGRSFRNGRMDDVKASCERLVAELSRGR